MNYAHDYEWSEHDFECVRCHCHSRECDCYDPWIDVGGGMVLSLSELLEDD